MNELTTKNASLMKKYLHHVQLHDGVDSEARLSRIKSVINYWGKHYLQKDFDTLTQSELETFFLKWKKGEIKKTNSKGEKPYSANTIDTNWKIFRKFYAYINGWDKYSMPSWLRRMTITAAIENPIDRGEYADKEKLDLVCQALRKSDHRLILKTLFDFGCSFGELMSLQLKHLSYDDDRRTYFFNFKDGFKKARKTRKIHYLWFEKEFVLYLQAHPHWNFELRQPLDMNAHVFPQLKLDNFNRALKLASTKTIGQRWTSHYMRRGFVTFCEDMAIDGALIDKRCGYVLNSKSRRHYSARSKNSEDALKRLFEERNENKIKHEYSMRYENLERENAEMKDQLAQLSTAIERMIEEKLKERLSLRSG